MPCDMPPAGASRLVTTRQSVQDCLVRGGLSRTPEGARQLICRTHDLTLRIARAQVQAGHREPVKQLILDLEALLTEESAPLPEAVLAHASADAADDVAVTEWLLDRANPTLSQRARLALGRTLLAGERLLVSMRRSA